MLLHAHYNNAIMIIYMFMKWKMIESRIFVIPANVAHYGVIPSAKR